MKYKRLTNEELKELETPFVRFLATNQITADEWAKMKTDAPGRVEELIEIFSDMVYDQTLKNIEYLEYKTPKDIKTFHCQKDKIVMMGLMVEGESDIDFTRAMTSDEMSQLIRESGAALSLYTAEKQLADDRETELFKMLNAGCLISRDGFLFKTLYALKPAGK
ncbi:MAG: hypothetical protein D6714_09685 [Bacteroidetes bacterium]|nr:MAG: hypothetical protein D6714_09685 [Bacteroidota bacterium]